jgi:CheY-like chemotaxis protein
MSNSIFDPLSVLVADDFASFRNTLVGMLNKLGIKRIEEATRAQEVIKACTTREFDLILCDYNLGRGRNGQHILEELRYRGLIERSNLFVMVTAEASKEMVLSAYDCEPDDYLMKPLNLKVLEQRLTRLVLQRDALLPVYKLLHDELHDEAILALERIVEKPGRHVVLAQKLLGQLYLDSNRLVDAEKLYRTTMDNRHLDWAQLGVAKVALAQGNPAVAESHLDSLIKSSRLFLPAHDCLAEVYEKQNNFEAVLGCMQEVVRLSPRSLLRQRKLAKVALDNGEIKVALDASVETMKLGEASCHKSAKDALAFLATAGSAMEAGLDYELMDLLDETEKCHLKLTTDPTVSRADQIQACLMTARVHALNGDEMQAKMIAQDGLRQLNDRDQHNLDLCLAHYAYLLSIDDLVAANQLADKIIAEHGSLTESSLQLDKLLPEPKNELNRQRVALLNKLGIDAYGADRFEEALGYFRRATFLFPRHVSLHLNYLQTMIGQLKKDVDNAALRRKVRGQIERLKFFITDKSSTQFARFQQLIDNVDAHAKK